MTRLSSVCTVLAASFLSLKGSLALPLIEQEARLDLTVDVLAVDGTTTGPPLLTRPMEIPPAGRATAELDVPWPAPDRSSHLKLEATGTPGAPGQEHETTLDAWLKLPDGRTIHSSRSIRIREGSTRLVEIFREGRRRLILGVQGERTLRPVVRQGPTAGHQVRFRLEVQRVQGEESVSLETNLMDTFVGEGVEYSFLRGQDDDLESLHVLLRPVRLEGEVAEVEVEVTGTLPGGGSRAALSRREHLLTTRGASSTLTVIPAGALPGYRFVITPDF